MPSNPADIQKILRDPQFQGLSKQPEEQVRVIQNYLVQSEEGYDTLSPQDQLHTAAQVLDHYKPGLLQQVAEYLPVVGSAIRAAESPEQTRPLARGLLRLLGTSAEEASPFARAAASVGVETAEIAALAPLGGIAARPLIGAASRIIPAGAEALLARAGAQVAEGAIGAAAVTAARSHVARYVDRAITDATIGALFGAADAIETGQLHPFEQFVVNPLAGAALGVLFTGFGRARERFGEFQTRQALQEIQTNPALQEMAAQVSPVVREVHKILKGDLADAGDLVLRGLREPVSEGEFRLLKDALTNDARLLKSDVGQRLLVAQKDHLLPRLVEEVPETAPFRINIELPGGKRETLIDPAYSDVQRLLAQHAAGDLYITSAEGRGATNLVQRARLAIEESYGPRSQFLGQLGLPLGERGAGQFERPLNQLRPEPTAGGIQGDLFGEARPVPPQPFTQGTPPVAQTRGLAPTEVAAPSGGTVTENAVPAFPRPQLFEGPGSPGFRPEQIDAAVTKIKEQAPPGTDIGQLLTQEQISASLPIQLRQVIPITQGPAPKFTDVGVSAPLRYDVPITSGRFQIGAAGAQEVLEHPQSVPVRVVTPEVSLLRQVASEGKTLTTQRLAKELGIPFDEAQAKRRELIQQGLIDRQGRPTAAGQQSVLSERVAAPTPPPEVGATAAVPGETEPGTVVAATPAQTVVQSASGQPKVVVPSVEGEPVEVTKLPGLPAQAQPPAEANPTQKRARAQRETKLLEIPEMTPEQRLKRREQLDRKLEKGQKMTPEEDLELEALVDFESEGKLSSQYASVRCRV